MPPAAAGIQTKSLAERGVLALPAAPENVFVHGKKTLGSTGAKQAWTNYYELPIEYTVELHAGLLSPENATLATRFMPDGLQRRFCVVDAAVDELYGDKIAAYFRHHGVALTTVVIPGEEKNKKFGAVERIFNALCEFGLLRREPIFGIGGGCVLDIVGFAASTYRRGVPYVRVPTTLLAVVDASVGVKCGVDWEHPSQGGLKNRMGAFYPPCAAFLDKAFIATQDLRNVVNGMGEIMKLALVRSEELFRLLETQGKQVVAYRFQPGPAGEAADRIIELSIQIMLEELGPNLWEYRLERCVDYGHTFSKILEMRSSPPLMHGEAVSIDGAFCVILSQNRGWISRELCQRILGVMKKLGLPVWDEACTQKVMWQGVLDGIEHRHGKLRMPLVRGRIGAYDFANDMTEEEINDALREAHKLLKSTPECNGDAE